MKINHILRVLATLLLSALLAPDANTAAVNSPHKLGGATSFTYTYDDLYRLTGATGVWNSAPNTSESFTLAMDYDTIHNIVGKDQNHIRTTPGNAIIPQHKTTYDWMYTYASSQPHAASLIGDRAYTYDANGNQLGWDHISNGTRRTITWDEENRIQAIADNGHTLTYVYDDAGERVIKSGPQGETAYVNQFFVVRNREVATKHVFAGGTRLVSKMASQPDVTPPTAGNSGQAPWGWLHSNAGGNSPNAGGTVFEKDQYYFHPDHLGSSSYVTDIDGEIFQHLEYFPFGETFVEESSNTQRTPYLFTGKELDEATGLYYFGARYYDPRTSVWQSPDPILASYMQGEGSGGGVFTPVNLNLYGYVQQRPVIMLDPNGQEAYVGARDLDLPFGPGAHGFVTIITDDPSQYGDYADSFQVMTNTTGEIPSVQKGEKFYYMILSGDQTNNYDGLKPEENTLFGLTSQGADHASLGELASGKNHDDNWGSYSLDELSRLLDENGKGGTALDLAILDAFSNYCNCAPYQFNPNSASGTYNSNSFIRAIAERAGVANFPGNLPGLDLGTGVLMPDLYFLVPLFQGE